jgi:hypothetical protein
MHYLWFALLFALVAARLKRNARRRRAYKRVEWDR